ncbi:MAG: NAD(P)/FAD-dependent oxidoreductase [Gammaproteobacteria bacterium]|nr:NAD(P)/FAD-dependent oxidoreductase [Gammaproteobacteria bacterium]
MKSAIIIGGGPAGCQCALWLSLLGHETLIIESADRLGGLQATSPYPNNWLIGTMDITGKRFATQMALHIQTMNIPVLLNSSVTHLDISTKGFIAQIDKIKIASHYLVIATGVKARANHLLPTENIIIGPGEKLFSYHFKNKRVAILGGGDNAAENYALISLQKPKLCHVYARTIRARKSLWNKINERDIYHYPYTINQSEMSILHNNILHQYDVMVVLYGWDANLPTIFLPYKNDLCHESGFIKTNTNCQTPLQGVYAIGEIANRMHPCVATAMADGVVAAKSIQALLDNGDCWI